MDSLLSRLQRALAGRYTVQQELGRGGMAVVFLGQDLRLDRRVAIKVYEREGGLISAGERFLREIQIAARLQHPNILPVFDSGEGEQLVYYVMPYVAGGSVRERIEREGPLPITDAVRIAREVAEALDHAHNEGFVHRDVKPDNIMLAHGVAVVADFGIARALEQAGGKVTDTGLAIGTPTYMSPEQASASPQLDGRTDIYSLGCVLYEMLAGAPPFGGNTAQQVMARHATDAVPPLSTVRQVTPHLAAALQKSLAKLPGDRWPSGKAFAEALSQSETTTTTPGAPPRRHPLRWAVSLGAVLLLGLVAILKLSSPGSAAPGASGLKSVAVLPFEVRGDTSLGNIAAGLTEAVITGLVRLPGLRIPASNRILQYSDRQMDPRDAGRELGVGAVLAASVRRSGRMMRINTQLISVSDGAILYSENFDGELGDVFAMQDSMTVRIVQALQLTLSDSGRAILARGPRTRDTIAYKLYLEATATKSGSMAGREERARRLALLQEALRRDSTFADAWVALADQWSFYYGLGGVRPGDVAVAWRGAIDRAIDLDPRNATAYMMRSILKTQYDWDLDVARQDMRRAVALAPASADVAAAYGFTLQVLGQFDSAVAQAKRSVDLDPTAPFFWQQLGVRYAFAGKTDSAVWASRQALQLNPRHVWANWVLMHVALSQGRRAEADSLARSFELDNDGSPGVLAFAAEYYRRSGDRTNAARILQELVDMSRRQYVPPTSIGAARLATGDVAGALDALEESMRNRDLDIQGDVSLLYHSLRGNPRYENVVKRVLGGRPVPRHPFS